MDQHAFEPEKIIGQSGKLCAWCDERKNHPNHMIASRVTLGEFLLARIAEDDETARTGFSHPDRWVRVAIPGTSTSAANGISCTAVLVECEAKRKIVLLCQQEDMPPTDAVLELMAVPYAGHPDYRVEWRPRP